MLSGIDSRGYHPHNLIGELTTFSSLLIFHYHAFQPLKRLKVVYISVEDPSVCSSFSGKSPMSRIVVFNQREIVFPTIFLFTELKSTPTFSFLFLITLEASASNKLVTSMNDNIYLLRQKKWIFYILFVESWNKQELSEVKLKSNCHVLMLQTLFNCSCV